MPLGNWKSRAWMWPPLAHYLLFAHKVIRVALLLNMEALWRNCLAGSDQRDFWSSIWFPPVISHTLLRSSHKQDMKWQLSLFCVHQHMMSYSRFLANTAFFIDLSPRNVSNYFFPLKVIQASDCPRILWQLLVNSTSLKCINLSWASNLERRSPNNTFFQSLVTTLRVRAMGPNAVLNALQCQNNVTMTWLLHSCSYVPSYIILLAGKANLSGHEHRTDTLSSLPLPT